MKTENEIRRKLAEINNRECLQTPTATIVENSPLALIQLEAEAMVIILEWALGKEI